MQKRNNPLELKVKASENAEHSGTGETTARETVIPPYNDEPIPTACEGQKVSTPCVPAVPEAPEEPYEKDEYIMASKFTLVGKIRRKTALCRVNRELCDRVQKMHPERDMSKIIEDALLTRLYLESRDAFDEVAVLIENRGGHIKC